MKKKIHIILFLVLEINFSISFAQEQLDYKWALNAVDLSVGGNIQTSKGVAIDDFGNSYVGGTYTGNVDFDPSSSVASLPQSSGNYLAKYDVNGNFVWVIRTNLSVLEGVKIDSGGFIYVFGIDFGIAGCSSGTGDAGVVEKYDSNGLLVWITAPNYFGADDTNPRAGRTCASDNNIVDIAFRQDGFMIVTGKSRSRFAIGIFNTAGILVSPPILSAWDLTSTGIALDSNDNIYITGFFTGNIYGNNSNGNKDFIYIKYDINGVYINSFSMGGTGNDMGTGIVIDENDFIYTTGIYEDAISIGAENFVSLGLTDVFIIKHDTTGNVVWVKSMGGVGDDQVNEIILDNNNNPTITGSFEGTALFNNLTINSNGLKDVFFSKYTSQGVAYWVQNIGGLGMDEGASIAMDISNNIFLAGNFELTVDFNLSTNVNTLSSLDVMDMFLAHYESICNVSDLSTTTSGLTITANNVNATYQWLDCDNSFSPISGETNQSFTALTDGNYAVMLTENGCTNISACVPVSSLSTLENSLSNNLIVYPNPSNGNFTINLCKIYQLVNITVYDINGKIIQSNKQNQSQNINLKIQNSIGVYFLVIEADDEKAVIRLVKE